MNFFDKNLAVIAIKQPALAVRLAGCQPLASARAESSRHGQPSLLVGQNRLTSSVDPQAEGANLARQLPPGPVVALGFGLGYHLEAIALDRNRKLVIWEPNLELLRFSLSVRDYSAWLGGCLLATEKEELGQIKGWVAFIPRAMQRLYPLQSAALERLLSQGQDTRAPRPQNPRVLVIPPLLGGTLDPSYWCAEALSSLGCSVEVVPMEQAAPIYRFARSGTMRQERQGQVLGPFMRFLGELAVSRAEAFTPDLVLALAQAPLDRRAVNSLKALGAATAFWFVEDFRQMTYFAELAATYDFFFYIQGQEMAEQLKGLGANHSFLPIAAHPPCHRPLGLSPAQQEALGAPIGFMGAGYPNRVHILTRLLAQGLPLKIWGSDWPKRGPLNTVLHEDRYISCQEVVQIYNSCPIVLNLHSSPMAQTPIGGVDFVNPRTFEVPACGAFQLVDKVAGLEDFFILEEELVTFASEEELLDKAKYYLENPGQRQAIAAAGRRRVLAQHTYYHRMEQLLDRCLGPLPREASQPEQPMNWLLTQASR